MTPTHVAEPDRTSEALTFAVIQGGMGSGVSGWALARAVSLTRQLGVVSGSGLDTILVRRLQDGDREGHLRRAMERFPGPRVARETLDRWYRPEGRRRDEPYAALSPESLVSDPARQRLIVLASFVETWLAKEGHDRPVGFNLLTKIQVPNLASLYGAMLAGIDVVLMGAGIPREIPAALDALARQSEAALRLEVLGMRPEGWPLLRFDPGDHGCTHVGPLRRPAFVPIVSSNLLATMLVKRSGARIDGLVIERPTAGGHNAPPRGELELDGRGEPVYGERDAVDLGRVRDLGLPFWVAGGAGWPEALREARQAGATGVQVGTLFACCRESGIRADLKREMIRLARHGTVDVHTDPCASPTGFPFKVVRMSGTLSELDVYAARRRACDMGYLRTAHVKPEGTIGYRCAAEPVDVHVAKGGAAGDTVGRRCLCNALMANIGLAQVRAGGVVEPPLLTSGDDLRHLARFLGTREEYSARDVVEHVLGERASSSS